MSDRGVESDGGYPLDEDVTPVVLETRERLTEVEQGQKALIETVGRIETKVEDVRSMVQTVDDEALTEARFNREYADTIAQWRKYVTVFKWVGAAVVILAAVMQILVYAGAMPI